MKKYIAILRGINVSGKNRIKMADLQAAFEKEGFKDVSTYIQSGNVFFSSLKEDLKELRQQVADLVEKWFGFKVPVIIRSVEEVRLVLANNPFLHNDTKEESKLHVTFLSDIPLPGKVAGIINGDYLPDEFSINGKEVYIYCPRGYGRTKLNNTFFESKLEVTATTRNWKTVRKLAGM